MGVRNDVKKVAELGFLFEDPRRRQSQLQAMPAACERGAACGGALDPRTVPLFRGTRPQRLVRGQSSRQNLEASCSCFIVDGICATLPNAMQNAKSRARVSDF